MKLFHEFRDPLHTFIRVDDHEREIIDSEPVQRLRHIHQLSLSSLVYPGATHRRFEHSLGVMELAGRVFDVISQEEHRHPSIQDVLPELWRDDERRYWRRAIRVAGLCHDVGHLPYSHVAEGRGILADGIRHEHLTMSVIDHYFTGSKWEHFRPRLDTDDVKRLAVGSEFHKLRPFRNIEAILAEVITGNAFGVDRIDYLLRDSLHCGVAYGKFDYSRLIDTLRVLPPPEIEDNQQSSEPQLGIEEGGLQSAEALLVARYFMYSQVYFHRVRRAFDLHLQDFLRSFAESQFADHVFPTSPEEHILWTDNEITSALLLASRDTAAQGHDPAKRIVQRDHFRLLWQRDLQGSAGSFAGDLIFSAAVDTFGPDAVRRDKLSTSSALDDFPVLTQDDRVQSAKAISDVLQHLPSAQVDYVFVQSEIEDDARKWLRDHRKAIESNLPGEEKVDD